MSQLSVEEGLLSIGLLRSVESHVKGVERNVEVGRIEGGNIELRSEEGSLYFDVGGGASVDAYTEEGRIEVSHSLSLSLFSSSLVAQL